MSVVKPTDIIKIDTSQGFSSIAPYELLKLSSEFDKILSTPTKPFDFRNSEVSPVFLASSLFETMFKHKGLGLSANQVGYSLSVFTCGFDETNKQIFFNPEIIERSEETSNNIEGCLSHRGLFLNVKRANKIKVRYQHVNEEWREHEYEGLTAAVIQHEMDHLQGKLFLNSVGKTTLAMAQEKRKKFLKKESRNK